MCTHNVLVTQPFRILFAITTIAALWWSSPATATLPPTNNLVMWLNPDTLNLANGAGVTSWTDSSTNGNDAILWTPWSSLGPKYYTNGINGRPAVGFGSPAFGGYGNTGNDALFVSNRVTGALTPISLPSGFTFATAFKTFQGGVSLNRQSNANNFNNMMGDLAGSVQYGLMAGNPAMNRFDGNVSSSWITDTAPGALNNTNVYQGHFLIGSHVNNSGFLNDTTSISGDGRPVISINIPYNAATDFRMVGQGQGSGGVAFDGLIGDFLVYSAPLSPADQQQLTTYLTERWLDIPEPSATLLLGVAGVLLWRRLCGHI